ncbi:hypothetical protein NHX12_004501 [Muraenolepis orangiensis]|uniref:NACHT domain-containing protein n=1 Tax=Muraenolepis orangiensis TaxID=630683 RepID=A0A9Q0IC94_9TELE|nr:hypothetical protein NHX12_004501 [Muraenolepis orangiensis]
MHTWIRGPSPILFQLDCLKSQRMEVLDLVMLTVRRSAWEANSEANLQTLLCSEDQKERMEAVEGTLAIRSPQERSTVDPDKTTHLRYLDSIFTPLKSDMFAFMEKELQAHLQVLGSRTGVFQRRLKSLLMEKFRRVFEGIPKAGQSTGLNDFYTELFLTERVSGEVNKEHEVRLIETASRKPAKEETPIKCEDIFKPLPGQDQPSRTIMTTGVAGIGKTVLTHKFTLDWAEGKANQDIDFTLPFTFRELNLLKEKEFSLEELLHHFFIQTKGIRRYDLFQVVFILDGLDECRLPLDFQNNPIWTDVTKSTSVDVLLTNLIRGNLLPSARIWITTRPAAANQIPAECVDMVTEVRGFTDPQKEEFFRKRFRRHVSIGLVSPQNGVIKARDHDPPVYRYDDHFRMSPSCL